MKKRPQPRIVYEQPPVSGRSKLFISLVVVVGLALAGVGGWTLGLDAGYQQLAGAKDSRQRIEQLSRELEQVTQSLAVAERQVQVTSEANDELKQQIVEMQKQEANLKADVAFYQRLLESGGKVDGLAIHDLRLTTTANDRRYRFTVTLSQNLKKAETAKGELELMVEGDQNDQIVSLSAGDLALRPQDGISYEFKYFQQLDGSFVLPEGFSPDRVEVRMHSKSSKEATIVRSFDWSELTRDV